MSNPTLERRGVRTALIRALARGEPSAALARQYEVTVADVERFARRHAQRVADVAAHHRTWNAAIDWTPPDGAA